MISKSISSIMISSLTNILALFVGVLSSTPFIRVFSVYTAVCLTVDLILQGESINQSINYVFSVFLFAPILLVFIDKSQRSKSTNSKTNISPSRRHQWTLIIVELLVATLSRWKAQVALGSVTQSIHQSINRLILTVSSP